MGARAVVPACPWPMRDASWTGDTTHQNNTHSTDSWEVCYRWHPWYGRTVWIYETRSVRGQAAVRCGLDPTQRRKSLEIPQWMLEAIHCSNIRLVDVPHVDCDALRTLKTLLDDSVVQGRHHSVVFAGGADAGSQESTTGCATRSVSSAVGSDRLAQAASGHPAIGGDVVGETASRALPKAASYGSSEGGSR